MGGPVGRAGYVALEVEIGPLDGLDPHRRPRCGFFHPAGARRAVQGPSLARNLRRRDSVLRCDLAMKSVLAFTLIILSASPAFAARDNFNRAKLGRKWEVTSGHLYLSNDQLQGKDGGLGYDNKSANDWGATATVYLNGTDLQYGAIALGDIAGGNNAYIKIQSQDGDGLFEYAAFYVGDNGGGGRFFALKHPASSPVTISAWFCGTYGFLQIKSAVGRRKFYFNYGTNFGSGAGLGTRGALALDNYKSGPAKCSPDLKDATEAIPTTARDLSK